MASIFILGETGGSELWRVDTGAGTVQSLASDGEGSIDMEMLSSTVQVMRDRGSASSQNMDVAIAAPTNEHVIARTLASRMPTSRMLTGRMLTYG